MWRNLGCIWHLSIENNLHIWDILIDFNREKILHPMNLFSTNLIRLLMNFHIKSWFLRLPESTSDLSYYPMSFKIYGDICDQYTLLYMTVKTSSKTAIKTFSRYLRGIPVVKNWVTIKCKINLWKIISDECWLSGQ